MGNNLLIVLLFCTFVAGCTGLEQIQPEAHVSTFKKLYPKSSHAEWERENGLIKVEFRDGRYEKEAWFLTDGTWVRTVTEIPLNEVPAAVISALKNRLGNGWTIDDVDLVEQKDDPTRYYLAECEKRIGETDIYIKLAEDGAFLNENEWKMFVGDQQGNSGGNNPDNGNSQGSPLASFTAMFPNAWDVEWENEHGMAKVEFKVGNREKESWFLTDGTWVRTVTEIPLNEVPAAVISALKNRLGNGWTIDDVDLVEQKDDPTRYYLAECEKRIGETDIYIKLAEDGAFLNENEWKMFVEEQQGNNGGNNGGNNPDNGNSQGSPLASFTAMFPNAWDVEWENEHGMAKVEFKVGNREKEAWFLTDGTWVRTVTEIPLNEVPAAVISALKNRLGNGWTIDDVDLVEQKDDPTRYYLAECEKRGGKQEIHLRVTPDGTIL